MKLKRNQFLSAGLYALGSLGALLFAEPHHDELVGNAKIPGTEYRVHDDTRPSPPIVNNAGAIVIKPPADAVVLFDGTTLDAWNSKEAFRVQDGILIADKGDIQTRQSFGDIQLHLEWRLPKDRRVNGQQGGNSGVFLNNAFEIQILQSHRNPTYPDGSAAALYGQTPPLVNATTRQGSWQSYDIIFHKPKFKGQALISPAYVTVIHNGVVVHSHKAFHGPTTHQKVAQYQPIHGEDAPIRLQWHSDPLEYRNIWVRRLREYDSSEQRGQKSKSK